MNSFFLVSVLVSTLGKFASAVIVGSETGEPGPVITEANNSMDLFIDGRIGGNPSATPPSISKGLLIVTTVAADGKYVPQDMTILLSVQDDGKDIVPVVTERVTVIENVMVQEPYKQELQYVKYVFDPANLDPAVQEALSHGMAAIRAFWNMYKKDKPEYADLGEPQFAYRPYWIRGDGGVLSLFVKVIAAFAKPQK